MKLKGISSEGIKRLARLKLAQDYVNEEDDEQLLVDEMKGALEPVIHSYLSQYEQYSIPAWKPENTVSSALSTLADSYGSSGFRGASQDYYGPEDDSIDLSISILDGILEDAENMDVIEIQRQVNYVLNLLTNIPRSES